MAPPGARTGAAHVGHSGLCWNVPIPCILGVSHPPHIQEQGPGHLCRATATGRAMQSETLPIALSSLAGHGRFFIFFSCAMNGFCCKL